MNEQTKQEDLVTSFLDEELTEGDIDALLDALQCSDLRSRACRQALASTILNSSAPCFPDISAQVSAAISREPATGDTVQLLKRSHSGRKRRSGLGARLRQAWLVPTAGMALAASVALVAVIAIRPSAPQSLDGPQMQASATAPMFTQTSPVVNVQKVATHSPPALRELVIAAPQQARPVVAQWHSLGGSEPVLVQREDPSEIQQQLNTFLVNHARHGGRNPLSGSLGYARVAASPDHAAEEAR